MKSFDLKSSRFFTSFGIFTTTVALLCIFCFLFLIFFGIPKTFYFLGYPRSFINLNFEYWRLITPIFIHFSLLHLIGNLCWWLYLGKQIEKKQGALTLFVLLIVSALCSNFMEYWVDQTNQFGGLSGVVFAVIGYVWIFGLFTKKIQTQLYLPNEFFILSLIWLIIGYLGFDIFGAIANTAHLSGLICGLLLGALRAISTRYHFHNT